MPIARATIIPMVSIVSFLCLIFPREDILSDVLHLKNVWKCQSSVLTNEIANQTTRTTYVMGKRSLAEKVVDFLQIHAQHAWFFKRDKRSVDGCWDTGLSKWVKLCRQDEQTVRQGLQHSIRSFGELGPYSSAIAAFFRGDDTGSGAAVKSACPTSTASVDW
jgi:hypothetical protein